MSGYNRILHKYIICYRGYYKYYYKYYLINYIIKADESFILMETL